MASREVVFIHGMYLNGLSWQPWVERFTSAGFSCSAPSWPYHKGDPRSLRSVVDPELGGLTFGAVTKHLKGLIMTPQRFHYVFANTVSRSVSDDAFEQFVVPESRNVPRSTLGRSARIDFAAPHAPLLFLTGDQDHLTPVAMVRRNAHKYVAGSGQADYQEFAGRSHYICAEPGWEEVADAALAWLSNQD